MNGQQEKKKGIADIVFLMDATGSMGNCIDKLKQSIMVFFRSMTEMDPATQNFPAVKDWRAKVVGFRDAEADGEHWFEDNAFTRDVAEIERQLGALKAEGGGDAPESLLDAIYKVTSAPKSAKGVEDPNAWRYQYDAARAIVVFTDAPFKPTMTVSGVAGGGIKDVRNVCVQNRFLLSVVAPKGLPGGECFEEFDAIRYGKWVDVPAGDPKDGSPIDAFMNNVQAVKDVVAKIAKTITQNSSEILGG